MASFSLPVIAVARPVAPTLAERAAQQAHSYWRSRTTKTLERLEREARKMLQLEEELGQFALQFYQVIGEAAQRLDALDGSADYLPPALAQVPMIVAQCEAREARRAELKARYRALAKDIHPDRAMVVDGAGAKASHMHTLNAAYQHGDLAALLRLEAEMVLEQMMAEATTDTVATSPLDHALREVERAADTYKAGYRALLHTPINALMLQAMSARQAGWDFMVATRQRIERAIEVKECEAIIPIVTMNQWKAASLAGSC